MIALAIWLAGVLVLTWLSLCAFAVAIVVILRVLVIPIEIACWLFGQAQSLRLKLFPKP